MKTKPIPDGYPVITPYLIVTEARAAIGFYQRIFGASERMRLDMPDGKIGHAELLIGGSLLMLADEFPEMGARGPQPGAGAPVMLHLYAEDVDGLVARALAAGARLERAVETKFYGDRSGSLVDPWGHHWHIATHVEDVSPEEMKVRAAAAMGA